MGLMTTDSLMKGVDKDRQGIVCEIDRIRKNIHSNKCVIKKSSQEVFRLEQVLNSFMLALNSLGSDFGQKGDVYD